MTSPCTQPRTDLLDLVQLVGPLTQATGPLAEHLRSCEDCAAAQERLLAQSRALTGLKRLSAPPQLTEFVSQALAPEGRAERIGRAVASLERRESHADLEAVVLGGGDLPREELHAPTVLDRLVNEELKNPLATQARRAIGRLPRVAAPAELDTRVELELASPTRATHSPGIRRGRLLSMGPRRLAGLGVAAALILWLAGPESGPTAPDSSDDYGFEIRRMDDLAGLDPLARELLDGLTGGILSAEGQR